MSYMRDKNGQRLDKIAVPDAAALSSAYLPLWKPTTAYVTGQIVLNPYGRPVRAISGFTSGASFSPSNWSPVDGFNIKDFGAVGDGTDATNAVNAALAAAALTTITTQLAVGNDSNTVTIHPKVIVPEGEYGISTQIVLPVGVDLMMAPTAKLKATATMTSILYTDKAVVHQGERYVGGILDCNGLAQSGFILGCGIRCYIHISEVFNPTRDGVIVGETGSAVVSYEINLNMRSIWRPRSAATTTTYAGYAGLWTNNVTDSTFELDSIRGFDWGTRNSGSDNEFKRIHPWTASGNAGPSACHVEDATCAGTRLIGYVFDTPSVYGLWLKGNGTITLLGGQFYLNNQGTDNTAIAIRAEDSPDLTALGCFIYGATGIRWKKDIEAATSTAKVRWLSRSDPTTVVTRNWGDRYFLPGFYLNSGSLVPIQGVAGSVDFLQLFVGSNKAFAITKDGGLTTGNGVTAGSTEYSGSGAPAAALGAVGDRYWRTDTPSTAGQRLYIKIGASTWTATTI